MIKVLVGGLFGLIFGWLWRDFQSTRSLSTKLIGEQYNRAQPQPAAGAESEAADDTSELQHALASSQKRARELQHTVDAQTTELKNLKAQLDKLGAQQNTRNNQLEALQNEHTALSKRLAEREQTVAELKTKTEQLSAAQAQQSAEIDSGELRRLRDELAAAKTALNDAQTERDAKTQLLQNVQRELEALRADQHSDSVVNGGGSSTSSTAVKDNAKASGAQQTHDSDIDLDALKASLPKASGEPDDLKKIKGIGEKIEAMLHELDITTFKQIASLSAEQRDQVAHVLKVFPDRAERDDWQGQAKTLYEKAHGKTL